MRTAFLTLLAAAVAGGVIIVLRGGAARPVGIVLLAVAALAAVIVPGVVATIRRRAESREHLRDVEARHGLVSIAKPDKTLHRRFGSLPGIPWSGEVKVALSGAPDGRPLTIFQHQYIVHTGQAVIPVMHTAYVTEAPPWPEATVLPRGAVGRILHAMGVRRGLQLEDAHFNRVCRIRTENEDFALTLLHPAMQRFMAEKPAVRWHVGHGWCAMIYAGSLRVDRIGASLQRLHRFWELVVPELADWE